MVLARIQLTLRSTRRTPQGASHLVHAMPAWSLKPQRAPSPHCRDARVYRLEATVIHYIGTPFPLTPPLPPRRLSLRAVSRYVLTRAPDSVRTSCAGSALKNASNRADVFICRAFNAASRGVWPVFCRSEWCQVKRTRDMW